MTKLSLEEYLNLHRKVIIATDRFFKVGEIIPPIFIDNGHGKMVSNPLFVVRVCTREEFLAQDDQLSSSMPYFYEVTTD